MRVAPPKPSFTVEPTTAGLAVTMPATRIWFVLPFMFVWVTMWSIGGITAVSELLRPGDHDRAFLAFWLVGWLFGELFAVAIILWQVNGRELLLVSSTSLTHTFKAAGLSRTREYEAAAITNLRAPVQAFAPFMSYAGAFPPIFGYSFGSIAFDYGAKTYRIGSGLDEAEARLVMHHIGKYFPRIVENAS